MKTFLGFEFDKDEDTTTGIANKKTGEYSIAGKIVKFYRMEPLHEWVAGQTKKKRMIVSQVEARKLKAGMTREEFNNRYALNFGKKY